MPLHLVHGMGDSLVGWASFGILDISLPLALADAGFDVWVGSNRGAKYSNRHVRDPDWSLEERWDFSFAEMGIYDMPAFLDKIIEVT